MLKKIKEYIHEQKENQKFMLQYQLKSLEICNLQRSFKSYEGKFREQEVVIVATGPTLNSYKPIKDAVHIGVNKAYKRKDINFVYYFLQDYLAVKDYVMEIGELECIKFAGKYIKDQDVLSVQIPTDICRKINAIPYYSSWPIMNITQDISCAPLVGGGSVTMAAMHFALYAGAKTIYLVGCDTSQNGYFDKTSQRNTKLTMNVEKLVNEYKNFRDYAKILFPETNIVSINPVGLKGVFEHRFI